MINESKIENYVFIGSILFLFFMLKFHMIPLLFAGLITIVIIENLNKLINVSFNNNKIPKFLNIKSEKNINTISTLILVTLITLLISVGVGSLYKFMNADDLTILFNKLISIISNFSQNHDIPYSISVLLPDNMEQLKAQSISLMQSYFNEITLVSQNGLKIMMYIIFGIVLGAIISFHKINNATNNTDTKNDKPLKENLIKNLKTFKKCFDSIVIAQLKISLINTTLTSIYILIILPLCGIDLPFKTILIIITFLAGLIPIVGNLISNTVIIIFSVGISIYIGIASLIFLVLIHKLEYFFEAKIIGEQINAKIYEILLAMIIFEVVFGITGLIVAPIFYSFIKELLVEKELI